MLHQLEIPEWKCDNISMDFVTYLPRLVRDPDVIWIMVLGEGEVEFAFKPSQFAPAHFILVDSFDHFYHSL